MEDPPFISTQKPPSTYSTNETALLTWCFLVLVLGLTGNIYVLYSTISHRAIKLDKMSVWIVQNLAVADIANCVLVVIPITVTVMNGMEWKLGRGFCVAIAHYNLVFLLANGFLLNALSLNKLLKCLFPFRMLDSTQKQRNIVTLFVVIFSIIPVIWTIYGASKGFFVESKNFEHLTGICNIADNNEIEIPHMITIISYIVYALFNFGPCVSLITANTALVIVAVKKSNTTVNKANIMIVALTTAMFLVAGLPRFITYIVGYCCMYPGRLFDELAWYILFSISWVNPFIYLATNKHFRDFTLGKLRIISSSFRSVKSFTNVSIISGHRS